MAIQIEELNIEHFRGIHNLKIKRLNHINLVVGDNNSGKTSVLEAMMLLRNPEDFTNVLRVARLRESLVPFNSLSIYDSFINLFAQDTDHMAIDVYAHCKRGRLGCKLSGTCKKLLMDHADLMKSLRFSNARKNAYKAISDSAEIDTFIGQLQYITEDSHNNIPVEINAYSSITGREIKRTNYLNIVYLSPVDHIKTNVFSRIIRDESYKEICVRVLQLFDPEINNLLILKNEDNARPIEYINHATLGNMPLSTYGDGIKKVLALANAIVQAANGVLLIDEIETAIHSKYYDDVFRFIVKACMQFGVQLFITTHSIEAVDNLLGTQNYEEQDDIDDISVVTFKKDTVTKQTYSRILSGRHVYSNREQFGFEVRL